MDIQAIGGAKVEGKGVEGRGKMQEEVRGGGGHPEPPGYTQVRVPAVSSCRKPHAALSLTSSSVTATSPFPSWLPPGDVCLAAFRHLGYRLRDGRGLCPRMRSWICSQWCYKFSINSRPVACDALLPPPTPSLLPLPEGHLNPHWLP